MTRGKGYFVGIESINPISRNFGFDRGLPIDRYYIESFLYDNSKFIKGVVLEVGGRLYTRKFGGANVKKSLVLSYRKGWGVDFVADLSSGEGVPENIADCFIMTQTLPFVYNFRNVIANSIRVLKDKGVLLITTGGVTQISRYDMDRWGHYWSFTDLSLRKLLEEFVDKRNVFITTYGNVRSASAFLYGLASEELTEEELNYCDPDYQVSVCARVVKG